MVGDPLLLDYEASVVDAERVSTEKLEGLGPLEAEVMRQLWAASAPMPVRAVLGKLNGERPEPLAYTTVMTVMVRLAEKGLLRRQREGRGYAYEPTVDDVAELAVRRVLTEFGDAAVARFVAEAKAEPALLHRLRGLLDADADNAPGA